MQGQTVAFVGQSGGGKSTLVSLVPRFYPYNQGKLLINGQNINDYSLDSIRDHIAYVDQNVVLFNDTVTNNIAYGSNKTDDFNKVIKAAKQAKNYQEADRIRKALSDQGIELIDKPGGLTDWRIL